ncbi:MAG: hypothetical protein KY476_18955 [Planctomycetes bacterium]|nr:hypothetical protein [Planctomycetota bacterium]
MAPIAPPAVLNVFTALLLCGGVCLGFENVQSAQSADASPAASGTTIEVVPTELFRGEMARLKPHLGVVADGAFHLEPGPGKVHPVDGWLTYYEQGRYQHVLYSGGVDPEDFRGEGRAEFTLSIKNFGQTHADRYDRDATYICTVAGRNAAGEHVFAWSGRQQVTQPGIRIRREQVQVQKTVQLSGINEPLAVWAYVSEAVDELEDVTKKLGGEPLERAEAADWALVFFVQIEDRPTASESETASGTTTGGKQ